MWVRTNNDIYLNTDNVLFFDVEESTIWKNEEPAGLNHTARAYFAAPDEDTYLTIRVGTFTTEGEAHQYIQQLLGKEEM